MVAIVTNDVINQLHVADQQIANNAQHAPLHIIILLATESSASGLNVLLGWIRANNKQYLPMYQYQPWSQL